MRTLQKAGSLHAPTLLDVEFLSALRGLVINGKLPIDRADEARMDFSDLPLIRYPVEKLADRIWALRNNLTVYEVEVYPLTPSR
ncbi:type II toxin-antitoxin system VapC family toxin [Nonomuraea jabiensis]|uniref:type II toxin-antitoxin system VapC family toxin n=1 Tax=Nonomuraea jabiensis TaxID=882448 RepID=UPI0034371FB8